MLKANLALLFIILPFTWMISGQFLFSNGDKILVIITVIALITTLFKYGFTPFKKNIINNQYIYLLIILSCISVIYNYFHKSDIINIRSVLCVILYFIFIPLNIISTRVITYSTLIGSIGAISFAFWQKNILHLDRAVWQLNAIPYAACCLILMTAAIILCIIYKDKKEILTISILSAVISFYAIILTETRGVLIAVFSIFLCLFVYVFTTKISVKIKITFITILITIGALGIYTTQNRLIHDTVQGFSQYKQGDDLSNTASRLAMWKAALLLIPQQPISGFGDNFEPAIENLYHENKISSQLYNLHLLHFHNQFIDTTVKHGIIGLVLLLLFVFFPFYILKKTEYSKENKFAIFLLTFGIIISGLTDVPLEHKQVFTLYIVFIYLFLKKTHSVK
ncbi:O-antigen ligase family protein [Photobacterium andalusiense]|uniref:O-Antigen ligase n=1 Tax=Photobacterium andalusiense TaxID=2204296 RepID=A0A1Y6MKH7_9GAMM|nr:O-antigen ligase family protein [Photobacterium andalusiense]SMY37095.1 O-Antigen ligase [Photobacterium andalusiense]